MKKYKIDKKTGLTILDKTLLNNNQYFKILSLNLILINEIAIINKDNSKINNVILSE